MSNPKPKFTPGPWKAESHDLVNVEVWNHNTKVANINHSGVNGRKYTTANAALISAAPEMYEALSKIAELPLNSSNDREAQKALSDVFKMQRELNAILKKARGEK